MGMDAEINWEAVAKGLQRDLESAQIKLASRMKSRNFVPDTLYSLLDKFNSLSYVEKIYTIAVCVMLAFYIAEKVSLLYRSPQ